MTYKINLLSTSGVLPEGAWPIASGIIVDTPWGFYKPSKIDITDGWYELRLKGEAPLTLRLFELSQFRVVELQANAENPAYSRLSAGAYELSVIAGGRPGFYPLKGAYFQRLSLFGRYALLIRRFIQALRQGLPLSRIASLITLALSKGKTFGVRANAASGERRLGHHAQYDLAKRVVRRDPEVYDARLQKVSNGPVFLLHSEKGIISEQAGLEFQVYKKYTLDPHSNYDFICIISPHDRLTPDALLLFAEHILRHSDQHLILADKWVGDQPTANVAWDPILYNSKLPTPHVVRKTYAAPFMRFDNQATCGAINVPVAVSNQDETYEEYIDTHTSQNTDQLPCSIIIPTRDRADLLEACLEGLFDNTHWPHEVIIVDNDSQEPETFAIFERFKERGLRIIRAEIDFNFAALCNLGANAAKHDYLVFLNNDVVLDRPDWLEQMMHYAVLNEVGAVGAKLLYADGRLQHGGIMLGLTQLTGHFWRGLSRDEQDNEPRLKYSSLRSAVTAACLCVAREKFNTVSGFDEKQLQVTLNDVDLCLKLLGLGYVNVYASKAVLYHLEGESRGGDDHGPRQIRRLNELRAFHARYQNRTKKDSWLSESYSRAVEWGLSL